MAEDADEPADTASSGLKSENAIRKELRLARGRPGGLSPAVMAQCPVICDLMGNGDPEVAHVQLTLKVLEIIEADDDVRAIEAACYSLGLASAKDTHLGRLEEFGAKHLLDQRQARRYSDRGVEQLARLIASNWTTQTVPKATLIIVGIEPGTIGFGVQLRRQRHVDMREPRLSIWTPQKDEPEPVSVTWRRTSDADAVWIEDELIEPQVKRVVDDTTLRLVWRGEVWPKFTVVLTGDINAPMVQSETLAAACAITVAMA